MFEASDCGRLCCQAADHPWSALRMVKSCRKDRSTAKVLKGGLRRGKRSGGNLDWLANQIDRKVNSNVMDIRYMDTLISPFF